MTYLIHICNCPDTPNRPRFVHGSYNWWTKLPCFHLMVFVVTVGTDHPWTTVPMEDTTRVKCRAFGEPRGARNGVTTGDCFLSHTMHGTGIFSYMNGWFLWQMVGKYTIHGCYGYSPHRPTIWTLTKKRRHRPCVVDSWWFSSLSEHPFVGSLLSLQRKSCIPVGTHKQKNRKLPTF